MCEFRRSGLWDMMAWAQEGHWLSANRYPGISRQKIAAFSERQSAAMQRVGVC
jgi:hypothetical protein